ncbi:MAG: ferrochelatase [Candidatus Dadabacteria bacterium]|nr:ferrochelatase [Candidatus Dadabacteria bacterium]
MQDKYDCILMIAFGGPEKPEDIRPFLKNVTRGRRIPESRLDVVARHYEVIGGKSPLNELTFKQAEGLGRVLAERGIKLPVYVGMRNWHPLLADTVRKMASDGVLSTIGLIMAGFQSFSSWEQYHQNYRDALEEAAVDIAIDYTPPFYNHPLFVEAVADRVKKRLEEIPVEEREGAVVVFTAHSIPSGMASKSPYEEQLEAASRLVAERVGHNRWQLAYQSRSGCPEDPWLEPEICDVIRELKDKGVKYAVVHPIGFVCDHVEVLFDIGVEAVGIARELGITLLRANTVNDDEKFLLALADIVESKINDRRSPQ